MQALHESLLGKNRASEHLLPRAELRVGMEFANQVMIQGLDVFFFYIWENFFSERRVMVESLSLEAFKKRIHVALRDLVYLAW